MSSRGKPSRDMRAFLRLRPGRSGLGLHLEDLAALVHAGLQVDVVRAAQLARILVLDISGALKRVGGTAHAAARGRGFSLRNSHLELQERLGPARTAVSGSVIAGFGGLIVEGSR